MTDEFLIFQMAGMCKSCKIATFLNKLYFVIYKSYPNLQRERKNVVSHKFKHVNPNFYVA